VAYIPPRTRDAWDLVVERTDGNFVVVERKRLGEIRIPAEYTEDDQGPEHKMQYELLDADERVLYRAAVPDQSGMNAEGLRKGGLRGALAPLPVEARRTGRFHLVAPRIPQAVKLRIRTTDIDPAITDTRESNVEWIGELPDEESRK